MPENSYLNFAVSCDCPAPLAPAFSCSAYPIYPPIDPTLSQPAKAALISARVEARAAAVSVCVEATAAATTAAVAFAAAAQTAASLLKTQTDTAIAVAKNLAAIALVTSTTATAAAAAKVAALANTAANLDPASAAKNDAADQANGVLYFANTAAEDAAAALVVETAAYNAAIAQVRHKPGLSLVLSSMVHNGARAQIG